MARVLYCSVDPSDIIPVDVPQRWDLGYLGTYSAGPAARAGAPAAGTRTPLAGGSLRGRGTDVSRKHRLAAQCGARRSISPPNLHRDFYSAQRFTLNITRVDMIAAGYSPSVRLFEAGACGVPIISDWWSGLDTLFEPGRRS